MNIICHENTKHFHLYNDHISYILFVQENGAMGQLYFGKRVHDREDFSYAAFRGNKAQVCVMPGAEDFSMELSLQEYPCYGSSDYGIHAYEIEYANGSRVSEFKYRSHKIYNGKSELKNLPATYAGDDEAMTLEIDMFDDLIGVSMKLCYTIFEKYSVIARHVSFKNESAGTVILRRAFSASLDLPDQNYELMQFSGAWARERIPVIRKIERGITSIESKRGISSANQNPFVILRRPDTTEDDGEAIGFSFVYSGNFIASADADSYGRLRMVMGIHPDMFDWALEGGDEFITPEVVIAYSDKGLGALSRTYHDLYNNNLIRGVWKNKPRPILLNNWEATFMDFDEEKILEIARKAKEAGVELFVLDDGWFGKRNDDYAGLGDWYPNTDKLPGGMAQLSRKVTDLGLKFGFWIEPEMVNPDSDLYRAHPDWAFAVPGRTASLGRHQYVLDFSRDEVVDYIYGMLTKVIAGNPISYIKWDMNRSLSEVFSSTASPAQQGSVYHKYVLGVYRLYSMLIKDFPDILFESCSSGGSRFDAGMLYYAPQAWCSDNTDAVDRIKIQYGSTFGYPVSSIGAHVSAVPNQQTGRNTSISFRADVACFGTFGYELDLNEISGEEFEEVKKQICFMKENRELLQFGDFYRLSSPFESDYCAWMVVSKDKNKALLGCYAMDARVQSTFGRIRLTGLDADKLYHIETCQYYGDELMNIGLIMSPENVGKFTFEQEYNSVVVTLIAE